jgi:NADH-ubiquinone oxidoreductase chain 3
MTSITFFFIFIPLLAIILLTINLIFAPHNPYQEKLSSFECGFHSFLGQNRTQFNISFFIFALLFLLFDLEILLVYPYVVSAYVNGIYGLVIMLIFFLALTLGFAFEIGKGALKIVSRQNNTNIIYNTIIVSRPVKYVVPTFFNKKGNLPYFLKGLIPKFFA